MTGSTCATGLTANWVWTAEAVATIWLAVALAKGIATMISATTAAGLATHWVGAADAIAAVWHTRLVGAGAFIRYFSDI